MMGTRGAAPALSPAATLTWCHLLPATRGGGTVLVSLLGSQGCNAARGEEITLPWVFCFLPKG